MFIFIFITYFFANKFQLLVLSVVMPAIFALA